MAEVKNYGLSGVHRTLQLGKQGPVLVGNADTDSFTVTLQDAATLTTLGGANATSGTHFITKSQLDSVYTEATFLANVNYNDTSPILLGNISSGTKTIITTFDVTTAFNANAVVTIGTSANANLLMSDNYAEIEVVGTYQTINTVEFASNSALNIYVTQGGATQGAGTVLVSVVDGPVVNGGTINYGAGGGGIALANLSVSVNSPSGNGSLSYNNTTGVFTFTPANLSSVAGNYGNSNVVTLLSSLGSNTIVTTGNISAGNILTSAEVIASGVIQSGTGLSTGGYLSVDGAADLHNTTVTGNISATGNVTANNFIGNISITGNVAGTSANVTLVAGAYSTVFNNTGAATFPGNITTSGNISATGSILATPAWTSAGAITLTATTTNPTKGTTTYDNISYRRLGEKQWEVVMTYIQTVVNGVSGSGDYLVTLPNSLSFDTTLPSQQITTTNIGTNTYALMSYIIPSGSGLINNDSLGGQVYPIVYDATKFRILTTTWGSAIQCWGSGYYSLGGDDPKIQLTFRFTST